ncbi:MoaD/ThiS family protein [Thermoanaerobacterium sp. DL9XJH110]|uniref:MoaD/ThiS family protein n=1 Tax=Thermoanaerobacterium sp. DL9XJH110 TaxID=3386643 RepID=UPI003BB76A20
MIKVNFLSIFQVMTDQRYVEIDPEKVSTVAELMDYIRKEFPEIDRYFSKSSRLIGYSVNVAVNGQLVSSLDYRLAPDARVTLMVPFSAG